MNSTSWSSGTLNMFSTDALDALIAAIDGKKLYVLQKCTKLFVLVLQTVNVYHLKKWNGKIGKLFTILCQIPAGFKITNYHTLNFRRFAAGASRYSF